MATPESAAPAATDMDTTDIFGDGDDGEDLGEEIARAEPDEIAQRTRMLENEIKVLRNENSRLLHEQQTQKEKIKENAEKIKLNKQLPYLVANVVELLDMDPEDEPEEDGANIDLDAHRKGKCCVLKTSTRQTIFLPVPGLVEPDSLKPADLVGVNKDSYLILEALPAEFDSRAMEVDEKPTEQFNDIWGRCGGLEDQIQELIEAIVLPMTHKERFANLGIKPPKGALIYERSCTGKTLIARACAAQTNACFLGQLAGPQLVQMFIGDGAKLVRDAFALAKEKPPISPYLPTSPHTSPHLPISPHISPRRSRPPSSSLPLCPPLSSSADRDAAHVGDDGSAADVGEEALRQRLGPRRKLVEGGHRLDLALLHLVASARREARVDGRRVNFEELGRCTDDFNGAQLKAVCVEAGMIALRNERTEIVHEDFMEGLTAVQAKKKATLSYYA
ncbi:hypothetical protein EMIHUDRAFT_428621 [Emiliania huxleyi CCMP1516]|uniref:AAA+ ATPase domain-containing protein n=2 Tax=Emiliania huxleyi TaxID=2903 RepID=A0A0D3HYZ9_EMIH1|nr:hypothetical protein EMIHUDRAFT_428621 [Emiliania huxleyi CCMP1516]EOD04234.1 hypothetical protein EMIHUDRAFT_428621 [Emiliania huxleyi CCMP1516]|eukprot:XP_005756663.1 hypothetical protein EMIHUDRAFT_428621 [Emiliania huxleyi CCMP1516]